MRIPFKNRYEAMGLNGIMSKGFYRYVDQYAEVVYRQLITMNNNSNDINDIHKTDNKQIPLLAIFTKHPDNDENYTYCGVVSDAYQFIGYDILNTKIRESINKIGNANIIENSIMNYEKTYLRTEFIIQNSQQSISEVGDIYPVIISENSYNGIRAAILSFGLSTCVNSKNIVFKFNLGKIKQKHIVNSSSTMTSTIESYMNSFSNNILELIDHNFNHKLTEDEMFAMLEVIEEFGKNRKNKISQILSDLTNNNSNELPSSWQMFLAITTYSSFETNLNIKRLLENTAESVLIIPPRIYNVLENIQKIHN
jgi:hypothetical protein